MTGAERRVVKTAHPFMAVMSSMGTINWPYRRRGAKIAPVSSNLSTGNGIAPAPEAGIFLPVFCSFKALSS
jgi:hypothetical protein